MKRRAQDKDRDKPDPFLSAIMDAAREQSCTHCFGRGYTLPDHKRPQTCEVCHGHGLVYYAQ